jgi:hypothetical protein
VRIAISQDFNGAPLSSARTQHQVTAESVRCRSLNPPSGVPECSVTYGAAKEIAIAGENATALFAALTAASVREDAGMSHITCELTALQRTVDDALAQNTPATAIRSRAFLASSARREDNADALESSEVFVRRLIALYAPSLLRACATPSAATNSEVTLA